MPVSHHSHSGQFCGHAQDTLEEVVTTAIERKMRVFALTEHMPREEQDLYPEEVSLTSRSDLAFRIDIPLQVKENITPAILEKLFDDYVTEAIRLKAKFSSHMKILVGMEVDWIRPSSEHFIKELLIKYPFDLFIGSIHHVHTRPIDYDHQMYAQARDIAGGTDERIFEDYFDTQYDMLKTLHPPIVGHFDVIRLKADEPDGSLMRWEGVWHRILRNLDFIAGYGGVLELNSAALRKGMSEPYPKAEVCKVDSLDGAPTLSRNAKKLAGVHWERWRFHAI